MEAVVLTLSFREGARGSPAPDIPPDMGEVLGLEEEVERPVVGVFVWTVDVGDTVWGNGDAEG
jgi:hypothetical protein